MHSVINSESFIKIQISSSRAVQQKLQHNYSWQQAKLQFLCSILHVSQFATVCLQKGGKNTNNRCNEKFTWVSHSILFNSKSKQFYKVENVEKRFFVVVVVVVPVIVFSLLIYAWLQRRKNAVEKCIGETEYCPKMIGAEQWTPYLYFIRFILLLPWFIRENCVFFFNVRKKCKVWRICTSLNRPLILCEKSLTHVDCCLFICILT